MAFTGTQTVTQSEGDADRIVRVITEAGGVVIWVTGCCSVFVSHDDAPKLVTLGWENIPGAAACFYVPRRTKEQVAGDLRLIFGADKLIFTTELD